MDTGSSPGSAPPSPAPGGPDAFVAEVADFWRRAADSGRRALDGRYSAGDAFADLNAWLSTSAACAVRLANTVWGGGRGGPASRSPGQWSAIMTVLPEVTVRPLTLRTEGLRAIGSNQWVGPTEVTFDPEVIPAGADTFTVTVSFRNLPSTRTLIVEGVVTSVETSAPVTDPVRANNRDGGPLR